MGRVPLIGFALGLAAIAASCGSSDHSATQEGDESGSAAEPPRIESLTAEFEALVPADARVEVLSEGHEWTEGPVWVEALGGLLYSDIPRSAIYLHRDGEGARAWLQPDETGEGGSGASNGLILDADGALLLAQHGDRRVARLESAWDDPRPTFTSLATTFEELRFNSPNDLVQGPRGDLYFTDPPYGLAGGDDDPAKELGFNGVYRLTASGSVELIDDGILRPNGVVLSPDARTLYVASSDPRQPHVFAYEVAEDGAVGERRTFAETRGDGMAVDRQGNLYVTEPESGVFVFDPTGRHLGSILTGQLTSNVAWGDDGSVLYITADSFLMRVRLNAVGLGF